MRPGSVAPFFGPSSVAVIGASDDPARIGGRPIASMRLAAYAGAIHPVNPRYREVQGLPCYADVRDVPGPVDLALVALPAERVAAAIESCIAKGIPAVTVFSSGFSELGAAGVAAQRAILASARRAGVRLLGPNCMGTMATANGFVGTFTSTIDAAPAAGPISVVSQSGAFAAHCFALLRARNVGVDLWAATGNESDVDAAECLAFMADAPSTFAMLVCVEGIRDGDAFCAALEAARRSGKPVVLLKLGVSDVGASAATSHTAALAGSDRVLDAVVREYGVHRVHSVDALIDAAYALAPGKRTASGRTGLASVSGGFGILMADDAAAHGLDVPALPDAVQARLRDLVPFAGTRNPLDLTAQFINEPALIEPMLEELLRAVDGPVVLFLGASGDIPVLFERLAGGLERLGARHRDRVMLVCLIASPATRARLEAMGYLVYEDPTRAVAALALLVRASRAAAARPPADERKAPEPAPAIAIDEGRAALTEPEAKALLAAMRIPIPAGGVATTVDDALSIAARVGFPVAMKIVAPDIPHKSDVGGVALDLRGPEAVGEAFARLEAAGRRASGQVRGVLVERMAEGGVELIVGTQVDPTFGPVVAVGIGGVHAEVLDDVVLHRAPVGEDVARALVGRLKGRALLLGSRGRVHDVDAAARAIAAVSRLAAAHRDVVDGIDVNPLLVQGRGVVALDALVTLRSRGDPPPDR